jgi:transmembrane sensor
MSHAITSIDETAERWAARLDNGRLPNPEERELNSWLAADPRHAAALGEAKERLFRLEESVVRLSVQGEFPTVAPVARLRPSPWKRMAAPLALAASLAAAAAIWYQRPQVLATPPLQRQTVLLADGSQVDLNARTSMKVRVQGDERSVRMETGEAYFAVAKDAARPFVVATPAGSVLVTGTAFNVRAGETGAWEVTVIEGTVEVAPLGGGARLPARRLVAGDQFTWTQNSGSLNHLSPQSARDAVAWREGRVVFESEPLRAALERFGRFHGRSINVDQRVASLEIGGRFELNELDAFLHDISLALPVRVLKSESGEIRVLPR